MGKRFGLISLMLCGLLFLTDACVPRIMPRDDIEDIEDPESPDTTTVTPAPVPGTNPNPNPNPGPSTPSRRTYSASYSFSDESFPLKRLELTASTRFIAEERTSGGAVTIHTGTFISDTTAVVLLSGYASTTVSVSGSKATIGFRTGSGKRITGQGTVAKAPSTDLIKKISRTWSIQKTRVSISDGLKVNADLNGGNLGELASILSSLGVSGMDMDGLEISDIIITRSGSVLLRRSDGVNYLAFCDFTNIEKTGAFTFTLDNFPVSFSGGVGEGNVKFQGDLCLLTMNLQFGRKDKNYKGSLIFVLSAASAAPGVKGLSFQTSGATLLSGEEFQLLPAVIPGDAACTALLKWEVSDPKVAKVTRGGLVTALAAGSATVTASDGKGHTASCTFTVK
ncbi:MAG: Ig-like domain-containing protein [Bacteroidales bacterium]|nr:Ig-like domain-containing protein [Bacteroidales bacterium]